MEKYSEVNINNFDNSLIAVIQIEGTNKFNVRYNDKLIRICSLNVCNTYGIKNVNNIYKISCIFGNNDFKNIFINIYERIKKIFSENKDITVKHPFGENNNKAIDFIIDKYTVIFNVTFTIPVLHNYYNLGDLLYKEIEFLPVISLPILEIKNGNIFLNFNLTELYINIKCKYTLPEINTIFNKSLIYEEQNPNYSSNSKSSNVKSYKLKN